MHNDEFREERIIQISERLNALSVEKSCLSVTRCTADPRVRPEAERKYTPAAVNALARETKQRSRRQADQGILNSRRVVECRRRLAGGKGQCRARRGILELPRPRIEHAYGASRKLTRRGAGNVDRTCAWRRSTCRNHGSDFTCDREQDSLVNVLSAHCIYEGKEGGECVR